jgi:hypothetical protein
MQPSRSIGTALVCNIRYSLARTPTNVHFANKRKSYKIMLLVKNLYHEKVCLLNTNNGVKSLEVSLISLIDIKA